MTAFANPPSLAIVVGLKFTDGGAYAFDQAARIARRIPGATLHLVHVFEEPVSAKEAEAMRQHLKLYANEKAASLGGMEAKPTGLHLRTGNAARAIAQFASDVEAGLVVVGADKHPLKHWFAPKTAEKLIALAPCPVLVAGPKPPPAEPLEPMIEPPCADCVAQRFASHGDQWWCARHAEHALAAHTFSYQRELPFATHDSQLGPTGV